MRITVFALEDREIDLDIDPSIETPKSLMEKLKTALPHPLNPHYWDNRDLQFTFDDYCLPLDTPLSQSRIREGGVIRTRIENNGGGYIGSSFNSLQSPKIEPFTNSAPDYRTAEPGISFTSKCKNSTCVAYNHAILVNRGFGDFNVGVESVKLACPMCGMQAAASQNCGFYRAKYEFTGLTAENETKIYRNTCKTDEYYTFEEGENIHWVQLLVKVEKYPPDSICSLA